jgi:predicted lipoprotein with Yx(FWY)xxD motif
VTEIATAAAEPTVAATEAPTEAPAEAATEAPTEAPAEAPTEAPTEAMTTTAEATTAVTETMTATVGATTAATNTVMSAATIGVSESSLGQILTGEAGRTLYVFKNDSGGTSSCYDSCAQNWPPLLTQGAPQAGTGADAAMLGTTERTDGTTQVTYNGMPLYYFAPDTAAGDVNGQGVGEVWYVVSPAGAMIE